MLCHVLCYCHVHMASLWQHWYYRIDFTSVKWSIKSYHCLCIKMSASYLVDILLFRLKSLQCKMSILICEHMNIYYIVPLLYCWVCRFSLKTVRSLFPLHLKCKPQDEYLYFIKFINKKYKTIFLDVKCHFSWDEKDLFKSSGELNWSNVIIFL